MEVARTKLEQIKIKAYDFKTQFPPPPKFRLKEGCGGGGGGGRDGTNNFIYLSIQLLPSVSKGLYTPTVVKMAYNKNLER